MRRDTESSRTKARRRTSFVPLVEFLEGRLVPGDALGLSGTALWGLSLVGPAGNQSMAGVALTGSTRESFTAVRNTGDDKPASMMIVATIPPGQRQTGPTDPTAAPDSRADERAGVRQDLPDWLGINDLAGFGVPAPTSQSVPVKRKAGRTDSGIPAAGHAGEAGGSSAITAPSAGRVIAEPGPLPEPSSPQFLTPNIPSAWLTTVVNALAQPTRHVADVRPGQRSTQPSTIGNIAPALPPAPTPVHGLGSLGNPDNGTPPPPDGNGPQDPPPDTGTLGYYSGDQQDENPPPDLPCPDCDSNLTPAQPDSNTGQPGPAKTEQPVRAFDGMPVISTADVASKAMGFPWGQTRSWSGLNNSSLNGNGWSVDELPYLVVAGGTNGASTPGGPPGSGVMPGTTPDDRISVVVGGASAATFYVPTSGPYATYTPWNSQTNRLNWITSPVPILRLTDARGNVTDFYDVYRDANNRPVAHSLGMDQARKYGRFKSYTTADGTTQVMAAYDANGYLTTITRSDAVTGDSEQFVYSYATVTNDLVMSAGATPPQLLAGVTLQRQDANGNWQPVQRARYTYYTGRLPNGSGGYRNDANGRLGDLQLVVMENATVAGDGSITWQQTDTKYYRYYKLTGESNNVPSKGLTNDAGTTGGPDPLQPAGPYDPHRPSASDLLVFSGLKTVVEGASFARLASAVPSYQTATDAALQPYVNHFFTYERWADHVGADGGGGFGSGYYNGNNDYYWRVGYRLGSRYRATEEIAQGQGCSACSGGQGTFKYEYASSYDNTGIGFNTIEYNIWRQKTTEFLPANNPDWGAHDRRILYTDEVGQVMLDVYVQVNTTTVAVTGMSIYAPATQATTITVTAPNHGLNTGDMVAINGVLPQLYDGVFTVTRVDANTFRFNLPYTYYGSDPSFPAPRPYVNQSIGGQQIHTTISKVLGQWATYSSYDNQGRLVLQAQPSAVSGYDDTYRDLLHNVGGNYQYLNDSSGLIETTEYYAATTATDTTPGGVAGYFYRSSVQQGERGTPVVQQTKTYYAHPAFTTQTVDVQVTNAGGTSATSAADHFTFGPPTAPVLTGLNPTSGSTLGGYPVTLSGSHFTGATGVAFGNSPASFTVDSDSSIRATAPAHAAGTITVTLVTAGGSVTGQFTYVAPPAPTVTGVFPNSGSTAGGSQVSISGTNFSGATAVAFGGTPATFTAAADNSIRATVPAHAAGVVDVTVTTPSGMSAVVAADHFTYFAAPVVTGVSPSSGPTAGGTTVTLTGSGFTGASHVGFGIYIGSQVHVVNDTTLTVTSPAQVAGAVDITVTTPGGTSNITAADHFTYQAPVPVVTRISPTSGAAAGGIAVTITGSGLFGATAVHFGTTAGTFYANYSDTSFTAYAPAHAAGVVDVTVTTAGGTSATSTADQFTYLPAPVITSVSPNSGPTAGGTTVTLTGSGFLGASTVRFGFYYGSQLRVLSDTTLTIVSPAQLGGTVDITVTTPGGTSAASAADRFTYIAPAPTVTGVSPMAGPVAGGVYVGITGTNLYGATAVSFGGTTVTNFYRYSDTYLTAYAPAHAAGVVDVTVTTPSGTSATSAADHFTYVAVPVITSVSPNSGPTVGGTTVTLTGSGFTGASAVRFGFYNGSQVHVVNDTTLMVSSPAQVAGTVDITVTTAGGTSATSAADRFTYIAPAPTVTGINPAAGPVAGGTYVGITGTNLYAVTAVSFGGTAATNFYRYSDTYVTAYAPAHAAGVVDVTVTTPSGTSAISAADHFTYVAAPVITSISPNSGPTAGGTTVTLTGSGFTGANAVRFGFYNSSQVHVVNDTTLTVTSPAQAAGTVDIIVTTPGGTSATSTADRFTYVAPVPVVTRISPSSGSTAGGTPVTITGTGFSFATQVAFGTTPVFFSVLSDTSIRVSAPSHARGVVDITVTTAGGKSATSTADQFTFTPPTVTGLNPAAGLTLGGTTVTITGTGFLNATRVLFGGVAATFTVTSDTAISARTPSHVAGTVDVTVSNAGDTSDTTAADQFIYQLPAQPVVTGVSPASGSVTGGDTVTISGSNFVAGTTTVTFGGLPATVVNLSANSITVRSPALPVAKAYPVAGDMVYRNTDGTGAETTQYAYTWMPGTTQMQSMTVSHPTVAAAQNGPGTPDVETTVYDSYGRAVWTRDGDGFLNYTAYDPASGAVMETIQDVDTTRTSDFQNLPPGWVTPAGGGLHLITSYTVDGFGRTTGLIDPNGNVTDTVYNDANHEIRSYPGWHYDATSSGWATTGPIKVSRQYWPAPGAPAGQQTVYQETLTSSAVPTFDPNSLTPTGQETLDARNIQSLTRDLTNGAGQIIETDPYFSLAGVTYTTADAHLGTASNDSSTGNYHATLFGYDERGRRDRVQEPTGTIQRNVYDGRDREVSIWIGTNDTPASGYWSPDNNTAPANMVQLTANVYDNGGIGDDNLTQSTQFPGGGAAPRVFQYFYDWRDWRIASKEGVQASEADGTHRPILYTQLDNLGEAISHEQYDGDGVSVTTTNGVPNRPAANLLRAKTTAEYDDQGRVFRTHTFSVDPINGTVSANSLTADTWYDHRGNVIKTTAPGGLVAKKVYDGVGRVIKSYTTDGLSDTTWANAGSVANNDVISQTETQYDANGNPVLVITRNRFHDETATGELGDPATTPTARVSYVAMYYDAVDRLTDQVHVGTNGGTAYQRPDTVPTGSNTILVTHTDYDAAGRVVNVTDPNGIVMHTEYDLLGRAIKQVENYQGDGTPTNSSNRTTLTVYNGNDDAVLLTAVLPSSGTNPVYEKTRYVYGVSKSANGSDLFSNDLVQMVQYPDKTSGDPSTNPRDQVVYTYDAAGEMKTTTDRNGTTHTYSYDVLGRKTADTVTTLGANVDGQVRRLTTAYDGAGRPYLYTSYDAAVGGNIVNQVEQIYNGLGQLTTEYQAHTGAVDPATTPSVQYVYSEMAGGANHSRLVQMIYPNGRVLWYGYNTGAGAAGLDDRISRLSYLADDAGGTPGTILESYAYLGLSVVVLRAHPESGVDLTYIQQPGDPTGDAGDPYIGLDRFGRVVDQRWLREADGSTTDRFQYGYDADGNALYRDNLANPQGNFGELYQYDQLNRLTSFARGTLSPTHDSIIDTPSRSQSWSLDALDNWISVTSDSGTETRSHNQQNQIIGISDAATPSYDSNGNLTATEAGLALVYDAWNRLVGVQDGSGNVLAANGYDPLNHRIITSAAGTSTDLYYSAAWQVLEEREGTLVRTQNVWSPVYVDALVLRDRDPAGSGSLTERLYVQQDANWNVTAIVDTSGTVQERYVYDPYGQATVLDPNSWTALDSSSFGWTYLYQGGRYDGTSGLYYFRNRDYSPTLGRWIQPDPAGFVDGMNTYVALESRPTSAEDPYGLKSIGQWIVDLAATTGGVSKTFPIFILPLGPTNLNVDMTLSGELKECTDKNGATHTYVQGSVTVEGYVSIGRSFKTHSTARGSGRNTRVPDPNAPVPRFLGRPLKDPGTIKQKKLSGRRTPPQPGYRERNGYVTFSDPAECDCPKSGLSFTGYVFVRGSIGFGLGAQFNIQQTINRNFDPLRGWNVDGSVAWGIYGASLEAGIGGSGSYVIYLS